MIQSYRVMQSKNIGPTGSTETSVTINVGCVPPPHPHLTCPRYRRRGYSPGRSPSQSIEYSEGGDCRVRVPEHGNKHRLKRRVKFLSTQSVKVK